MSECHATVHGFKMAKKKDLSHEEVWDDSVLVDSWNEALEEYKKYHSMAAKGEKVELVLDKAEAGQLEEGAANVAAVKQRRQEASDPPVTNGEVAHAPAEAQAVGGAELPQTQATVGAAPMPQALLNSGKSPDGRNAIAVASLLTRLQCKTRT